MKFEKNTRRHIAFQKLLYDQMEMNHDKVESAGDNHVYMKKFY